VVKDKSPDAILKLAMIPDSIGYLRCCLDLPVEYVITSDIFRSVGCMWKTATINGSFDAVARSTQHTQHTTYSTAVQQEQFHPRLAILSLTHNYLNLLQ
jgi:hypothetical protein